MREILESERRYIAAILALVLLLVGLDLAFDYQQGADIVHMVVEVGLSALAAFGIYILLRQQSDTQRSLKVSRKEAEHNSQQAELWKSKSRAFIEGLSQTIDDQLSAWSLSKSEKEIALLLLKGLSTKEISEIRGTSEKTIRGQAVSIYAKAGLTGRSELAAFFLEDLLTQ